MYPGGIVIDALLTERADDQPLAVAEQLSDAAASLYCKTFPHAELVEFTNHGTHFLFDAHPHRLRTVLALAQPDPPGAARETAYQRGYPLLERVGERRVDRGHFIPYTSGGAYGPNLYVQDRALNRGWSREGRQYRALERRAATAIGKSLMFAFPIYVDDSLMPGFIQIGVLADTKLEARVFRNRFDDLAADEENRLSVELSGATDAQVGALGEETVAVLLEDVYDATLVALGDAGMERVGALQDLDLVAIVDGSLVAFEVKTRHTSRLAGKLTRAGNLRRPRLRRTTAGHRQGGQRYVAERIRTLIDVDDDYQGVSVQVVAVDFIAMAAQFFAVNDSGTQLTPLGPPIPCQVAAEDALTRILEHRDYL